MRPCRTAALIALAVLVPLGCARRITVNVNRATAAYPMELHSTESINAQVFRRGTWIEIVNTSTRSFSDAFVWVNQRYRAPLPSLPAGARLHMSLEDFYDIRGETFRAGGFFQTEAPSPVRLVEIQENDFTPMVGLVAIPSRLEL